MGNGFLKISRGIQSAGWVLEVVPMSEKLPDWTGQKTDVTVHGAFYKVQKTWVPCVYKKEKDCSETGFKLIPDLIVDNEIAYVQLSAYQRGLLNNNPNNEPIEPIGYCEDMSHCGTWTSIPSTTNPTVLKSPEVVLV